MFEDPVFGQLVRSRNGSICSQQKSHNQSCDDILKSKNFTTSMNLTYSLINNSEHIQYRKSSKLNINDIKCVTLNETNVFKCICAKQGHANNCQLCNQKGQITGKNSLINFFSYIIQFKLRKCQSYRDKGLLSRSTPLQIFSEKSKATTNATNSNKFIHPKSTSSQLVISQQKLLSEQKIRQKCQQQMITHQGFSCDICHIQPIKGSRYNCKQCNNFDLCAKCYFENGHPHSMEQTKKCLLNLLTKSQYIQSMSLRQGVYKNSKNSKSFQ